ncbi:MAG TPA: hypothetical protein PLL30_16340 [Candidatus Krumholzibacteria bacterium]|nr:hypothetical protein [Candidatus Krumholzibacteria bacterium]HPD73341.1 hypothetical protein [Candidatus Krumholzibacteria bacterium]HRY42138.1 hypothetical protein [Candidatus Krumholzibacteria bacterium]
MREAIRLLAVAALWSFAGCGGGRDAVPGASDSSQAARSAPDTAAVASARALADTALVRIHGDAGFRVCWPPAFGEVHEQVSNGPTRRAEREYIYTCDVDGIFGAGASIRCMKRAHDRDGQAAHPLLVTELIKAQLERFSVVVERQRALDSGAIQGVDVQAGDLHGPGELWIRGLLAGTDIYLLMAWKAGGGLYDDPEIANFFASFRLETR